ncbi:sulfur carrier protein ThiS [Psychromonas aquimarina]|uniref:sulfur carrier protein ThiS n=1 Tax=Psychromonas aquimarina TaxID=444919 RepID=UPI000419BCB4|nr:sulfur carrier protein ThiS [Psychromonas aquimarina]
MNIFVNEQALEVAPDCNIEELLEVLDKPLQGTAVAVNQNILSRSLWGDYFLQEGDQISLFQAIAGG